jgi:hypothetical protein
MVEADQRHEQADVGLRQLVAGDVLLAAQHLLAAVQRRKELAAGRGCVGAWPTQCVGAAPHSRQAAMRMSGPSPKSLLVRRLLLRKACMSAPLPVQGVDLICRRSVCRRNNLQHICDRLGPPTAAVDAVVYSLQRPQRRLSTESYPTTLPAGTRLEQLYSMMSGRRTLYTHSLISSMVLRRASGYLQTADQRPLALLTCIRGQRHRMRSQARTLQANGWQAGQCSRWPGAQVQVRLLGEVVEGAVEHAHDLRALVVHDRALLLVPQHRHRVLACAAAMRVRNLVSLFISHSSCPPPYARVTPALHDFA